MLRWRGMVGRVGARTRAFGALATQPVTLAVNTHCQCWHRFLRTAHTHTDSSARVYTPTQASAFARTHVEPQQEERCISE